MMNSSLASVQTLTINDRLHFDLPPSDWEMIKTSHLFKKRVSLFRLKSDPSTLGTQIYLTLLNPKKQNLSHYFGSEACRDAKEKMQHTVKTSIEVTEHVFPGLFDGSAYCTLSFSTAKKSETQVVFSGYSNHENDEILSAVALTIKSDTPEKVAALLNRLLAVRIIPSSVQKSVQKVGQK